jgi:tetratricopeptide (TPR) repeat protein
MPKHPSLLTMLAYVPLAVAASQSVTAEGEFETALKLKNKGDYNAAIEHLLSAVALDPKLTKAHFELGTMADICCGGDDLYHRCELALKEYKKVLEIEPLREDAVKNLAYALYQRANVDEAESYYRKALVMDRNDPEAMCGIAAINHQRSLLVEATARSDNHLEFRQPLIASPSCWMVREKTLTRLRLRPTRCISAAVEDRA